MAVTRIDVPRRHASLGRDFLHHPPVFHGVVEAKQGKWRGLVRPVARLATLLQDP